MIPNENEHNQNQPLSFIFTLLYIFHVIWSVFGVFFFFHFSANMVGRWVCNGKLLASIISLRRTFHIWIVCRCFFCCCCCCAVHSSDEIKAQIVLATTKFSRVFQFQCLPFFLRWRQFFRTSYALFEEGRIVLYWIEWNCVVWCGTWKKARNIHSAETSYIKRSIRTLHLNYLSKNRLKCSNITMVKAMYLSHILMELWILRLRCELVGKLNEGKPKQKKK